jgi:alanine racemase
VPRYQWELSEVVEEMRNPSNDRNYVEIDLSSIRRNLRSVRRLIGTDCKLMSVLKGNGYGHGASCLLPACESESNWYGVATLGEALELREAGTKKPILVFGWIPPYDVWRVAESEIVLNVYSLAYAREIDRASREARIKLAVHIEIDTGLGRTGLRCLTNEEADSVLQSYKTIMRLDRLKVQGIYTHFSSCDSDKIADVTYTKQQHDLFEYICGVLRQNGHNPGICHCLNSVGIEKYHSAWKHDMVRAGRMIYGIGMEEDLLKRYDLHPALSWFSRVVDIKVIHAGGYVGYDREFRAEKDMRIAILAVGYGDGYKQIYSNKTYVVIAGRKAPSVGKISMDSMAVDVTDIPDVHVNDWALLLGKGNGSFIPTTVFTQLGGTNSEVLLSLTSRVRRYYVDLDP